MPSKISSHCRSAAVDELAEMALEVKPAATTETIRNVKAHPYVGPRRPYFNNGPLKRYLRKQARIKTGVLAAPSQRLDLFGYLID